jgi:outer membrane protein OmpA-like peptidoglycan-associated protein
MVRATFTVIVSAAIFAGGGVAYSAESGSKAAKEFATQKIGVCCFVGMKNLPDENAVRAAQYPDLSGQLTDAKRTLANKESENADLARQLATAKAAQHPDLSGQNADLTRQLAVAKAAQNPDLSGQLTDAKRNLANKESENADLARQNAVMREARDKQASDIAKALAEKGSATLHGIFFDFDKSTIKAESQNSLLAVQQVLNNDPSLKLEIQGYADNVGGTDYNDKLSHRRADAVKNYVVEHYGIAADRLSATGFGETMPVGDNNTSVGRGQNRRVVLIKK